MTTHISGARNILAGLTLVLLPLVLFLGSDGMTDGRRASKSIRTVDTLIIRSVYQYRTISTMYDSVVLSCMYGEICVPGNDTLMIPLSNNYRDPGIDTSDAGIYSLARTSKFWACPGKHLSMFRFLALQPLDLTKPLFVPDTCSWVIELRRVSTDELVVVLDSVGFCRQRCDSSTAFPVSFGTSNSAGNSYDMLNYDLSDYFTEATSDSVYMQFRIRVWNAAQSAFCNMLDHKNINAKFSEDVVSSSPKSAEAPMHGSIARLYVFPTPMSLHSRVGIVVQTESYLRLELYDPLGKRIRELYSGMKGAGTHILPIGSPLPSSGVYSISVKDESGKIMAVRSFQYIK
jgi:hypothetical protein